MVSDARLITLWFRCTQLMPYYSDICTWWFPFFTPTLSLSHLCCAFFHSSKKKKLYTHIDFNILHRVNKAKSFLSLQFYFLFFLLTSQWCVSVCKCREMQILLAQQTVLLTTSAVTHELCNGISVWKDCGFKWHRERERVKQCQMDSQAIDLNNTRCSSTKMNAIPYQTTCNEC